MQGIGAVRGAQRDCEYGEQATICEDKHLMPVRQRYICDIYSAVLSLLTGCTTNNTIYEVLHFFSVEMLYVKRRSVTTPVRYVTPSTGGKAIFFYDSVQQVLLKKPSFVVFTR